jgi:hypothetical protein
MPEREIRSGTHLYDTFSHDYNIETSNFLLSVAGLYDLYESDSKTTDEDPIY